MEHILLLSETVGWAGTISLTAVFILSKCFFLAPFRIGWLMMMANVVYETLFKKCHWHRVQVDGAGLILLTALWSLTLSPWAGIAIGLSLALLWAVTLNIDRRWRAGDFAHQDQRYSGRVPIPVPRIIVNVRGPVLHRGSVHELGDWPLNRQEKFELLILNPSPVVPQFPLAAEIEFDSKKIQAVDFNEGEILCPDPGQYTLMPFSIKAVELTDKPASVKLKISHGDTVIKRRLRLRSIFDPAEDTVIRAEINRWKGGAAAGFAWRGDQDLYDPATFQCETGLRHALGLSMRFRLPSTLYLSGALSLNQEEHRQFCQHFGWNRRSEEIPDFIRFLKERVDMRSDLEFPVASKNEYAMELGNHMYVHLGTHSGAAAGNNWKSHAWIGDGRYPWQSEGEADSFSEQRDNAIANNKIIAEKLGVTPASWGVPGRTFDRHTARAVEAAGIEFGTDTDASGFTNVLRLPPPHHPEGCDKLVEITKKYPGDPDDAYKTAMLKYWAGAARRHGRVFLFMAHHHLLAYQGCAGTNMTREILYYVLGESGGDFYAATVTALGRYWRTVMSPRHRCVKVEPTTNGAMVENTGSDRLEKLPLEIEWRGGRRMMTLVDLEPGENKKIVFK